MPKQNFFQRTVSFTQELFNNYGQDDAFTLGAALAYYTVFSFAPLLVVAIAIASYFMGEDAVTGRLYGELEGLLGPDAATTLQDIVSNAYSTGDSLWATVLSVATLLFTASTVFATLKMSLNKIWQIEARPANNIIGFLVTRLLSFGFVVGLGFLLMITLIVNALIIGFMDQIASYLPALGPAVLGITSWVLATIVTAIIFALLFRFLPDAKARWKDIWAGAIFTALLFGLGRYLIGLYIGNSNFSNTYGAAGALVTLLVWTFYNSLILFLGAEFTFTWAKRRGFPIRPDHNAVRVIKEVRKVDGLKV
ncbi:membrane protein [Neolewinella xylanilytica]|uniref:Membrane protein n=1 Tax=Neolewinella xylanilytica TaxID=1514080 RepID=A0A2S6I9D2_9BACT|nr:YihY/virulence factor BrkB family protein [Neolewinella xylanilytica]PPK88101.1 membrane protein [Neolewinella xylanilytica]